MSEPKSWPDERAELLAEIERLNRVHTADAIISRLRTENERLRAENAEMRAVLEKIAHGTFVHTAQEQARAVLEAAGKGGAS
jgi:hypothetical protein